MKCRRPDVSLQSFTRDDLSSFAFFGSAPDVLEEARSLVLYQQGILMNLVLFFKVQRSH